jgi:hypothetical protein
VTQDAFEAGKAGCFVAGVPDAPVGRALMEGSAEIAALPPWPASVPCATHPAREWHATR